MASKETSRRTLLRSGAGSVVAGVLSSPMVHAQGTGGTLRCGFWDHWVPASNGILRELCKEWGDRNRVDVQVDYVTSNGNQILLTIASQAQSRTGYDLLSLPTWQPASHAQLLEPVDDVVGRLVKKYGPVNPAAEYLGKQDGVWRAIPAVSGTQMKPACVRFDLLQQHAGIDIRSMWPAEPRQGPGADTWNWDTFAKAAEACGRAGFPFGLPMGFFSDAVDWVGALFASYGTSLMDEKGNSTAHSDPRLRAAIDMCVRISKSLPKDVWAWDDASNNRALISGRSALVFNPPSAWVVAKRDAPQVAANCWTVPMPAGPEGRFQPYLPFFWGIWNFGKSKSAAKALLEFLSEREQAERQVNTSSGYDIPPFPSMSDFKVWETEGQPVGSVYNYPIRPHHNAQPSVAMAPAPAGLAVQAYTLGLNTKLIARIVQGGDTLEQALIWVDRELNTVRRGG